jgi:hypothetical protein
MDLRLAFAPTQNQGRYGILAAVMVLIGEIAQP